MKQTIRLNTFETNSSTTDKVHILCRYGYDG